MRADLRAKATRAVDLLDLLQILLWEVFSGCRVRDEESVMSISGRMLLRLEEYYMM